jgi:phosphoribosylformimino-5-aminoimidazole carboxamide ribotide isomerase
MIVIPAVDIKGGRCVRLKQGRMSEETVYSDDPVQMAVTWCSKGAERLHLVDLDGAVGGKRVNAEVIRTIARSVPAPVELGGGIRSLDSIEFYLEAGVEWVILGTVACKNPQLAEEACRRSPCDARDRRPRRRGGGLDRRHGSFHHQCRQGLDGKRIAAVIYTDIQRRMGGGLISGNRGALCQTLDRSGGIRDDSKSWLFHLGMLVIITEGLSGNWTSECQAIKNVLLHIVGFPLESLTSGNLGILRCRRNLKQPKRDETSGPL